MPVLESSVPFAQKQLLIALKGSRMDVYLIGAVPDPSGNHPLSPLAVSIEVGGLLNLLVDLMTGGN